MTEERRDTWECWEISHAGDGERSRHERILSVGYITAQEAAEQMADYLDHSEMLRDGYSDSDFDGLERWIEVELSSKTCKRFCVRCKVERKYTACEVKPE